MTAPPLQRLRTMSLRRRVIGLSVVVLVGVLGLVLVSTDLIFNTLTRNAATTRLADRAVLADQLLKQGVPIERLADRLSGQAVQVRLVTRDGRVFGGAPATVESQPAGTQPTESIVRRTLSDGSRLTLVTDTEEVTASQQRLRRVLLIVGLSGLAVAALILAITTRLALAPLDAITNLARSITRGDRGRRLAPRRTDTELGRTAVAFDDMLDALEGAERQARDAAAVASQSEAKTRQFVADAAHELRTPLAGVQAAAEAAVGAGLSSAERERLHILLVREARRAGRLVEDLLVLARIDAGLQLRREDVDLLGLAGTEAERLRLVAPEAGVQVHGEPVTVRGDRQRLGQVLANLLDNARRHTPDGGAIAVTVGRVPEGAVLTVTDDGGGVPAADRERIFDRLVRLDDARTNDAGGAGLGLAIARGIVRAHGGELRCVEPANGVGATFVLTLPAGNGAVRAAAAPPPPAPAGPRPG
ncbi:MAG: putative histidine kinase [Pseudonocardia sp.]|nr:putative histidine kinase [Pseudonocardia sp.]